MALNAALKQLIETKPAHTHELQRADHRGSSGIPQSLDTAITVELVSIRRIEHVTTPGVDTPFRRACTRQTAAACR